MLGTANRLLSTTVSDYRTAWGPQVIDLGHGEAASFLILVSDGGQSLPSRPDCGAAVTVTVTLPDVNRGIEIAAPSGLIAYPFAKGGPCGGVYVSALLPGSAQRLRCPACFPTPVPGKSVTSDTVKIPEQSTPRLTGGAPIGR
jgi:hypothetical protein